MFNRIVLIIAIFAILSFGATAKALDLGLVSVNDTISFPLICLDTLGRSAIPDSVHVITWYQGQGANSFTYSARSVTPKSTSYIDTVSFAGVESYYFVDIIDHIDSISGSGLYSGQVVLWRQNQPTINPFTFTKIEIDADNLFARIDTTLSSRSVFDHQIDKVDLADNAVNSNSVSSGALASSKFAADFREYLQSSLWANIDTSQIPTDSSDFIRFLKSALADAVWDEDTTGHYSSGKYGFESLQASAAIPDSITARIDSILFSLGFDSTSVQRKTGAFGSTESSSTNFTLLQWLANSIGIDGTNSLHSKVDGLSLSGGGTEPETLIVLNNADSTLLQNVRAVVRTIDGSTVKVDGLITNLNGRLILDLDADSFFVALTANNYDQLLDTLVIAQGGGTDSLWLTSFDPGNPPSAELCRVYGWVYDLSGRPLSDIDIIAEIPDEFRPLTFDGVIITPIRRTTSTDDSGYWYLDLLPNAILSDPASRYSFTIEYPPGVIFKLKTEVPQSANWQLQ